jgi:hypothetical protein
MPPKKKAKVEPELVVGKLAMPMALSVFAAGQFSAEKLG